jgi:glycerol-3-phosphate acyltransferase PlsY
LGAKAGVLVLVLDLAKAIVAILLTNIIIGNNLILLSGFPDNFQGQVAQVLAATIAMLGHNWSVFMRFRGGKGVTAYEGGWLAIYPALALFGGVILIPTVIITRYVSLGSMMGSLGILCLHIILVLVVKFPPVYLIYSFIGAILIIYQHRENINRLRAGTERRFSLKSNKPNSE